ncbi:hypothetical protein YC2023_055767 [Brassica napus]
MEEDDFSVSLPSFGFSFITGLLSCVAVCTGPEDATEITMCCLASEGCPSTSHYVTKSQLSDSVGYAPSTHPNFVLNSLSSCFEDLSFLICHVSKKNNNLGLEKKNLRKKENIYLSSPSDCV